ncbi:SIR2 family NAD-dependent protein deacylase [Leptospira noguchii]|uniref:SIR2 family NAD-dependent protein deacylase n=1 Tax=Leptospira noguchii TaxID=28182 RepID=UPI0002BEDED4|nr:NAD-dependent deacylase [Leptospira noguchii]EMI65075.1 transcriptional regulator, Sir2 family [Leptospira noguchii str. Bonito]EMS83636.1 transcriptional regulator, Sir2 family [Leptospira noguchii str. Cascata]
MKEFITKHKGKFQKISAISGAGISAESGIPTFRGNEGLWKNFRAEDLATPEAFSKNPKLVWEWYLWRRNIIESKRPNPGHEALVILEKSNPDFFLITQNVDGLHSQAGSKKLTEIHGNIFINRCISCGQESKEKISENTTPLPPQCKNCNSFLRPGVVWFGESYDDRKLNASILRMEGTDLLLILGTSGSVSMPVYLAQIAKDSGAFLVEINPERSSFSSSVDLFLQGKTGEVLPLLVREILDNRPAHVTDK